tara:strand:- start:88 stop:624 length:537 start_codon:yes stop_codon:yes gene_type:complete
MIKIINNVLTTQDCFSLYNGLIKANMWTLHMASADYVGGRFPGVSLIGDGEVRCNQPYWLGYFNCLFDRINQKLKEQHEFVIRRNLDRLIINAQNKNHYVEFHPDSTSEHTYSIVGFLTPQWAEDWGGEFNVEGKIIKYKPGDFVMFDSVKTHTSQKILKDIPYWRMTVSYVIKKSDA